MLDSFVSLAQCMGTVLYRAYFLSYIINCTLYNKYIIFISFIKKIYVVFIYRMFAPAFEKLNIEYYSYEIFAPAFQKLQYCNNHNI